MIAFYDGQTYKLVATVELVDGELKIDGDEPFIYGLMGETSPEDFVANPSRYNNGYIRVYTVKEGKTAPKELKVIEKQVPGYQV
jgi:hypothetical protein